MPGRLYPTAVVLEKLEMPRRTFNRLRRAGKLPFLQECTARLGRIARYRAEPIDRYLENRRARRGGYD